MYKLLPPHRLMATKPAIFFFLLGTVFLTLRSAEGMAQGNLMITPRRVVFEGQQKTQDLNLANTGKDTARYLISMLEIRMKEDGTFEQITQPDSGQYFASSYIRFFPRSVKLGPGEAQTIKIQITKQSQLVEDEYRSHIYFRAIAEEKPLGKEVSQDNSGISVQITPVFGISIPVIIHTGITTSVVSISNTLFAMPDETTPVLNMVFNRSGSTSVYGDLTIDFISPQGKVTRVGTINGIAVYTPTLSRRVRIALDKKEGINYKTGKLLIVYKTSSAAKSLKMAETELIL